MSESLSSYLNNVVCVLCCDGRIILGILCGFDQTINIILQEAQERIYSIDQSVEQVLLGIYIIRGDNVAMIGEINEELDVKQDFNTIRAKPFKPIKH